MRALRALGALVGGLGPVLVPVRCPGCGRDDVAVCGACRERVLRGPLRRRVLDDGTPVVASCPWRGPAAGLVGAHKERGRDDALPVLGLALARAVGALAWPADGGADGRVLLVPPPSSWRSRRARAGARPAEALARSAAAALRAAGAPVTARPLLRAARAVRDQAGLDRDERAVNLAGAFRAVPRPSGLPTSRVVVVDDVVTSGATVLEAVRALRAAGADVVGAAAVAAA